MSAELLGTWFSAVCRGYWCLHYCTIHLHCPMCSSLAVHWPQRQPLVCIKTARVWFLAEWWGVQQDIFLTGTICISSATSSYNWAEPQFILTTYNYSHQLLGRTDPSSQEKDFKQLGLFSQLFLSRPGKFMLPDARGVYLEAGLDFNLMLGGAHSVSSILKSYIWITLTYSQILFRFSFWAVINFFFFFFFFSSL